MIMAEKEKIFTRGNLITMTICIGVTLVIAILLFILTNSSGLVNNNFFKIESFNMDTEKTDYTYSDNYYTYTGTGVITCLDKNTNYFVLIEKIDNANDTEDYTTTIVMNGKGEFGTYDSTYSDNIEKPEYEFKVIGFIPFEE